MQKDRLWIVPLILTISVVLAGCGNTVPQKVVPTNLGAITASVKSAKESHQQTLVIAQKIKEAGTSANSRDAKMLLESAVSTGTNLDIALMTIDIKQREINVKDERLNYLEVKYQQAVELVWKWRMIALIAGVGFLGLIAVIIVSYLKGFIKL